MEIFKWYNNKVKCIGDQVFLMVIGTAYVEIQARQMRSGINISQSFHQWSML